MQYEIYARALARHATTGIPLDAAFAAVFRETFGKLDDRVSALVLRALDVDLPAMQQAVDDALAAQKGKTAISLPDALALLRSYQVAESYRALLPWVAPLIAEDDAPALSDRSRRGRQDAGRRDGLRADRPSAELSRNASPHCSTSPSTPIP